MFRFMNPIPKEEDFDEVETKIEELLLQYESISSPLEVEELMRQFASWAIDYVKPKPKDEEKFEIPQGENIGEYRHCEILKRVGFNACIQEIEENKKSIGL